MIKIRAGGAVVLLIAALFFLTMANTTIQPICAGGHQSESYTMADRLSLGYKPNSMGFDTIQRNFLLYEDSFLESTITSNSRLTDVVLVMANITSTVYIIAVDNNSVLNAKTFVYLRALTNITVNGVSMVTGQEHEYKPPYPIRLLITQNETLWIVRLRQVSSLDDIDDDDREPIGNYSYNEFDLLRASIAGIPASFASLGFWIVFFVLTKSQKVQEGLPNEL